MQRGDADAVLCGQGITAERQAQVDFTRPYAVFHEGVLIRRGDEIHSRADLAGRKVAAIENSTNMAQTFAGAEPVAFGAGSDDVYADMLAALLAKDVDAVVDDDVVFVPLGATHPDYELAFTVQTEQVGHRGGQGPARHIGRDRRRTRPAHRLGTVARGLGGAPAGPRLPVLSTSRPLVAVIGRRAAQVSILRFSATVAAEAICEAVWAAGGEPVVLHGPAADPRAELPSRLERFDGVLLPGGADVEPRRYGAEPAPQTADTVAFQDEFELGVTHAAIDAGLPALAICRGLQVLNVALGGTLIQHLPEPSHHNSIHPVTVTEGSRLHAIVGAETVEVSSYHHQAVETLGRGLTVTATAADGVIEAVEHARADILAAQWHPEDRRTTTGSDAALFADLVDRARKRKET